MTCLHARIIALGLGVVGCGARSPEDAGHPPVDPSPDGSEDADAGGDAPEDTDPVLDADFPADSDGGAPDDTDALAEPRLDADVATPEHIPGALFDRTVGDDVQCHQGCAAVPRCERLVVPDGGLFSYPVGAIDLTGDGTPEVVLFNQACEDPAHPGHMLAHPIVTYDALAGRMQPIGSFLDHVDAAALSQGWVSTAAFVDMNGDGKLDLVSDWAIASRRLDDDPGGFVLLNDGLDRFFLPRSAVSSGGASLSYVVPSSIVGLADADGDGDVDLTANAFDGSWNASLVEIRNLSDAARRSDAPGFFIEAEYFTGNAPQNPWAFGSFAFDPLAQQDGYLLSASADIQPAGLPGDEFAYRLGPNGAAQVGPDFISVRDPSDAYLFNFPNCPERVLSCVTPMGGSQLRLPSWGNGVLSWRNCFASSTGSSFAPVLVLCESPTQDALWEDGSLSAAFSNTLNPQIRTTPLAWVVEGRFDANADGLPDVIVTNGEDAGVFPVQDSYVYLTDPGCVDGACPRYQQKVLPKGAGHAHGLLWFPVQGSDGRHQMLMVTTGDNVGSEGFPQFVAWQAEPGRRWFSLQVGAFGDLSAIGAIVHYRFRDALGGDLHGQVFGSELQVLNALATTWGFPGANLPIVLGVPERASSVHVRVEFPGAARAVAELDIDAASGWNRPYEVHPP